MAIPARKDDDTIIAKPTVDGGFRNSIFYVSSTAPRRTAALYPANADIHTPARGGGSHYL
jgi:hypothetical protein